MEKKKKIRVPDIVEAVFDICYLLFDLIAGIIFLTKGSGNNLFILYGILTLTLCFGDAFHLVPRVIKGLTGGNEKVTWFMNFGLQVSSITMTVFYILLLYIWKLTFPDLAAPLLVVLLIWITALIRIFICFLPQNNWYNGKGNMKLSLIRNGVFLLTGIGVMILYGISGNTNGYHMTRMIIAIIISFGCYLPVTILSKKKPMIGMLMMPKTCAYIWIIAMGLNLMGMVL
ncbi:MAG: hypothetical protein MJ172_06225 [Clostridia bacterium]|nr:hypothetical protein [Clostridia bacterium]